jgi:hypothetical protein
VKHFVVYDLQTGDVLRTGVCPDQLIGLQAREGEGCIETAPGLITVSTVNLDPVKVSACAYVDSEAEKVRARFITIGAGQAMTYTYKLAEAREFVQQDEPTAADFPFLNAEAIATGTPIAQIAALVLANAEAWSMVGAKIEGARLAAKAAVQAATNVAQIASASMVDWDAALA